jgi:predicted amidohydrolase YtcJ
MTHPLLFAMIIAASGADLVVENARIWSDGRAGFASFAAVADGRFVYVGAPDDAWIGPNTARLDAGGRVVLPGLIDAHVHMLGGGRSLGQLQLRASSDKVDFVKRVADWAAALPEDGWILGGRWSTESWPSREQPTKDWVDPVTGDRPLFLPRMDGHSALVNSAALRRAGITREGPADPVGGVIDRDPDTNEPTGILRESAMGLVSRFIPADTIDDDIAALRRAMQEALRHGVTAVSDIPGLDNLPAYERLAQLDPPVRFYLYPTASDWPAAADRVGRFRGRPGKVEIRGYKAYLDGSLGSRTAMMHAPFLNNEPGREQWRGLWREGVEDGRFERNVAAACRQDVQTIVHAIGDEANRYLLDTLAKQYPDLRAARCRGEHAQHLLPADIQRFGELGVIASMQPFHKADDGRYAEDYIGAERCESSYAYRSLLDAEVVVAFGSDWPVVTINPFLGIEAAVTGRTLDGRDWQTQESIPVAEALRAYTSSAAYAAFADDEIGRIAPGYHADFIVLNTSPFADQVDWSAIRPLAVYVSGRLVLDAAASD